MYDKERADEAIAKAKKAFASAGFTKHNEIKTHDSNLGYQLHNVVVELKTLNNTLNRLIDRLIDL